MTGSPGSFNTRHVENVERFLVHTFAISAKCHLPVNSSTEHPSSYVLGWMGWMVMNKDGLYKKKKRRSLQPYKYSYFIGDKQ